MSKIIPMKIAHRKPIDRAEVIADELFEKYNANQQEDEDGDYSKILLDSIKIAEKRRRSTRSGLDTATVGLFKKPKS